MAHGKYIQPVVLAVIRDGDKYLFTKRSSIGYDDLPEFFDKWEIAGGGMEFGEDPIDTLHREVREELGIEVELISPDPMVLTETREKWQGLFLTYLCKPKQHNPPITLNEESSAYTWATVEELRALPRLNGVLEAVEYFAQK